MFVCVQVARGGGGTWGFVRSRHLKGVECLSTHLGSALDVLADNCLWTE